MCLSVCVCGRVGGLVIICVCACFCICVCMREDVYVGLSECVYKCVDLCIYVYVCMGRYVRDSVFVYAYI